MTPHLVSLGDLVIDLIAPVSLPILPFQHQESRALSIEPGGSGNFMITAARLGLKVSAVGVLGDDLFGRFLIDVLQAEGIDTRGIEITPGATSTVVLDLIDHHEKKHVFVGNTGDGPPASYRPEIDTVLSTAGALFFQGYSLVEKRMQALAFLVVERARSLGIPAYFDVGPTTALLLPEQIRRALELTSVVMTTEDEVPLVANGLSGEEAYAYLLGSGPELLVIKQGGEGCMVIGNAEREHVPGFAVPVVDTVGAGDCFDAAFIYGRLRGLELRQCAILANAAGAACVQKVGAGRNAPSRGEIERILGYHLGEDNLAEC